MSPPSTPPWMPELCRLPRLAAMLGLAELVVVVLALARMAAATGPSVNWCRPVDSPYGWRWR